MSERLLRFYPDPVLFKPTTPVDQFDDRLKELAEQMLKTMYLEGGIGLAAPQVGASLRLVTIDVSEQGNEPMVLVNPTVVSQAGSASIEEGCLSLPGVLITVPRAAFVEVAAYDLKGNPFSVQAEGLEAICIQHELDHLEGITLLHYVSGLKKELEERRLKKRLKSMERR